VTSRVGRVAFTPEARQQLDELDDWIASASSPEVAQRFVSAVLDHIDGIPTFPQAGRARHDIRPGVRTTTYRKRTIVAYEIDTSGPDLVVTVLGVFHGGQDWSTALRAEPEID
jgi:toxin ParE1/3/4